MVMRTAYTFAKLVLSRQAYNEIADKLRQAGYDHAFLDGGIIDMHGIGITETEEST